MNHRQLAFAREFRGFNQSQLAKAIPGLSQSNLSKFEQGLNVLSEEIQARIISYLNFPAEFFNDYIQNDLENAHYRKRLTITKGKITEFELNCKLVGFIVDKMAKLIQWPDSKIFPMDVEEYTPKYIAQYTRKLLEIKNGDPVRNVFSILESLGIIIYEIEADEKFDGISFITDAGYPLIIINKFFSNDRKRRTLIHEFGHLIMHHNFPIPSHRTEKEKEAETEIFTSEFLMPEDEIRNSLRNLKMSDLTSLKQYWLTSMSSIIRRAKDLGFIDKDRYRYFSIEMSRNGWSKNEPVNVIIDKPRLFELGYNLIKNDLSYSIEEMSSAFKIPTDVIERFLSFKTTVVKLRIT